MDQRFRRIDFHILKANNSKNGKKCERSSFCEVLPMSQIYARTTDRKFGKYLISQKLCVGRGFPSFPRLIRLARLRGPAEIIGGC